jgi:hypothetical protein
VQFAHVRPQPPQLLLSICVLTHAGGEPHGVSPGAHPQMPFVHVSAPGQVPHDVPHVGSGPH